MNTETTSIKNISDLATVLDGQKTPSQHTRFFRGHSNCDYELKPSIYRLDEENSPHNPSYLIENEDRIIKDALIKCSDYFLPSDTLFDKLIKLQHYGYATRLLDLTSNALVALYFASLGSEDKDGELIVLDIPDLEIKYDNSDVVSILSALSLRKHDFSLKEYIEMAKTIAKMKEKLTEIQTEDTKNNLYRLRDSKYIQETGMFKDELEDIINNPLTESAFQSSNKEAYKNKFKEVFNQQPEIARLLHDIRKDKPSFAPIIDSDDFNRVVCVYAKMNNPRIVRQHGSFLLFGMNQEKKNHATVKQEWKQFSKRIIVKKEAKENILKSLKDFGISRQTLFPELDSQAKDIMEKYQVK
jgi:hypothetical protein